MTEYLLESVDTKQIRLSIRDVHGGKLSLLIDTTNDMVQKVTGEYKAHGKSRLLSLADPELPEAVQDFVLSVFKVGRRIESFRFAQDDVQMRASL